MAIYGAVLDACVLVPVSLADTLLRIAERQVFRPAWSQRILDEVRAAILKIHPDLDPRFVDRRLRHMSETFPSVIVDGYESIESGLQLPDPNDNHVLAAAIRGHCQAIVTHNLRDFPADYLDQLGLEAISPDDFLLDQLDLATRTVVACIREQAAATASPPLSVQEVLASIRRAGAPNFADEVLSIL